MSISSNFSTILNHQQFVFFQSFFRDCPKDVINHMIYKTYSKDHILIHTDDICAYVYILLDGRLQAIEEKASDITYNFTEIDAIQIVGDFELFNEIPQRIITLTTMTKSHCLVIPAADYFSWIKMDANALFIRTQMLIKQLTVQTRFARQNLFLDNRTRVLFFLYSEYSKNENNSILNIALTRLQIANKIGCSVRTINRTIHQLKQEQLITLIHGKIQINQRQYLSIKKYITADTSLLLE